MGTKRLQKHTYSEAIGNGLAHTSAVQCAAHFTMVGAVFVEVGGKLQNDPVWEHPHYRACLTPSDLSVEDAPL